MNLRPVARFNCALCMALAVWFAYKGDAVGTLSLTFFAILNYYLGQEPTDE